GLTLKRANFEHFVEAFEAVMAEVPEEVFLEEAFTDGQLQAQDFSLNFADMLKNASIWGHGFVPPVFDGIFEVASFRILKDKHLKLALSYPGVQYPIDAIWFNFDAKVWDYQAARVHVLFELDINEWNGNQSVQLMIKDLTVIK
ncbi:MAG: single-stranded-DNA-specific exonuclease RecJ, partial [Psychrobacter sp.]|nr:single-stranded-DNA-specific exonuclease RecJ [Psychrobacter sp.]